MIHNCKGNGKIVYKKVDFGISKDNKSMLDKHM